MCCTLRPAELSNTVLYAGEAMHEGNLVHVLGYQNRTKNRFNGPNAMILPLPAAGKVGPRNCLETSELKWLMHDLAASIRIERLARSASKSSMLLGSSRAITVFDSGMYTVVLAEDARDIPTALDRVPAEKRPGLNAEIFDAYAKWYPDWPIALCCFESSRTQEPEPLLWWFEPKDVDVLFAPALDAHDGNAPYLKRDVRVDHSVVFGSDIKPRGAPVRFRREIPQHVAPFIANRVVGEEFKTMLRNGDFVLPMKRLASVGERDNNPIIKVSRQLPPGA
jgi:hypothetical protein